MVVVVGSEVCALVLLVAAVLGQDVPNRLGEGDPSSPGCRLGGLGESADMFELADRAAGVEVGDLAAADFDDGLANLDASAVVVDVAPVQAARLEQKGR